MGLCKRKFTIFGAAKIFIILPQKMNFKRMKTSEIKEILSNLNINQTMICVKCGSRLNTSKRSKVLGICSWGKCKKINYNWSSTIFKNTKISKVKSLKILEMWMYGTPIKYISLFLELVE